MVSCLALVELVVTLVKAVGPTQVAVGESLPMVVLAPLAMVAVAVVLETVVLAVLLEQS
jgi:hypothetical protein